jgi:hypothetical protein
VVFVFHSLDELYHDEMGVMGCMGLAGYVGMDGEMKREGAKKP